MRKYKKVKMVNQYVITDSYVMQPSPLKNKVPPYLQKQLYTQDSYQHRQHLLEIIQKAKPSSKSVHRPNATLAMRKQRTRSSHDTSLNKDMNTNMEFKVGFSGNIHDLYKVNNQALRDIEEEKEQRRLKNRS